MACITRSWPWRTAASPAWPCGASRPRRRRHDIARIGKAWLCRQFRPRAQAQPEVWLDARLGWLVIIGSVPIAVGGLLFQQAIETHLRNLYLTAFMLIGFGVLLGVAERCGKQERTIERMSWRDGILFGVAQAMALIPGVSRSGGTITAGLLMGCTREAAARYSLLLAIPAVMASGIYQLRKNWGVAGPVAAGPTLLATAVAFVVGYGIIVVFPRIVSSRGFRAFVAYRIVLGAALLVFLSMGYLSAH